MASDLKLDFKELISKISKQDGELSDIDQAAYEKVIDSISSGGVLYDYDSLSDKPQINNVTLEGNKSSTDLGLQSTLTFDTTPTPSSTNPATSGGIHTSLQSKQDKNHLWNSTTQYEPGHIVVYNDVLYECLIANTNVVPTSGTP